MRIRSTKELLIIVRDNLERLIKEDFYNGGICAVISDLYIKEDMFTYIEYRDLMNYLNANKSENASIREKMSDQILEVSYFQANRFWWKPRAIAPRLEWLNKQIEKL